MFGGATDPGLRRSFHSPLRPGLGMGLIPRRPFREGSTSPRDRLERSGMTDEQKQTIGRALGKVPSGVYILTVTHEGQSTAALISWAQQAGFEPPAMTIAMAKDRHARSLIDAGGAFALSILAKTDVGFMKKYGRGIPEGEDPFAGINIGNTPGGAIYLADSLAWLECRLLKTCDFGGDHDIYVAGITAAALLKDEAPFTHVRGNGFHY